jgi:hypothetical protein
MILESTTLVSMTMTEATGDTWRAIRLQHRELPAVTVSVVPGRGSGHGEPDWDADAPELKVAASTVSDGPEAILGYLLHQAAHGLVRARGGPAGSSNGRLHPRQYQQAAADLGLQVDRVNDAVGWARTTLGDDLRSLYGPQLKELAEATATWTPPARRERNEIRATCQCDPPRTIRVWGKDAADDLRERPVICSVCGQPFTP